VNGERSAATTTIAIPTLRGKAFGVKSSGCPQARHPGWISTHLDVFRAEEDLNPLSLGLGLCLCPEGKFHRPKPDGVGCGFPDDEV
jgi:hypothetical protein